MQPDAIVYSSLMEALNNGSQPERVLQLMKFMKQKQIPLNQKAYFEIIASCSMYVYPPSLVSATLNSIMQMNFCITIVFIMIPLEIAG